MIVGLERHYYLPKEDGSHPNTPPSSVEYRPTSDTGSFRPLSVGTPLRGCNLKGVRAGQEVVVLRRIE